MSIFHPISYQPSYSMFTVAPHWCPHWRSHGTLSPVYTHTQGPLTIFMHDIKSYQDTADPTVFHHFYEPNQIVPFNPFYYYKRQSVLPLPRHVAPKQAPRVNNREVFNEAWPEGFILRGELRWGKLERVFGANQELPVFVKEDLRWVYGTYPSTSVSICYQNGEFLVRGSPRVGEQEYIVQKKVVRKEISLSEEDIVSEAVEKKNKKESVVT